MAEYRIKGLATSSGYRIKGIAPQANASSDDGGGLSSIPGDVADAGANLLMAAGNKALQLPDELQDAGEQLIEHPLKTPVRASRGILASLLEGGKQLYNLPINLNSYLASKDIPVFKQTAPLMEKLKIGDTGLQKLIMGEPQKGDALWSDIGAVLPMAVAPELAPAITGGRSAAITSRGITNALSRHKQAAINQARQEYGQLFTSAADQGMTHAFPTGEILQNRNVITRNSSPKHHRAYNQYLQNPTIENAHWAQSELGDLERHLQSIDNRQGLTPTQHRALRAARETRANIRDAMFSENALGANPELGQLYQKLATRYRENVVPYNRLEPLSEVEQGRMRPKKAIKDLMNDEEFRIQLARRYPGLFLHTPAAKNFGMAAGGLLGYDELKKLFKSF